VVVEAAEVTGLVAEPLEPEPSEELAFLTVVCAVLVAVEPEPPELEPSADVAFLTVV
jgi:hypothetical protein